MAKQEMLSIGAPELPAGYYYRVRSNTLGMFYVGIKKSRKRLWDKTIVDILGKRWSAHENRELTPQEAIVKTANLAYAEAFSTQSATRSW